MRDVFNLAYMTGAGNDVASPGDIPESGQERIEEAYQEFLNSLEAIISRADSGNDMEATARKLAATAMRVYYWAYLEHGDEEEFLSWVVGDTEHCGDCITLSGQVHTRREWADYMRDAGYFPRSGLLECTGLYCQCNLSPTNGPSTGDFLGGFS